MMKISDRGLSLIKTAEGCRLKAYLCPAKVLTIGYGHTGPDVFEGQEIDAAEAEMLLRRDVAQFERCITKVCPGPTTQSQFDAMVSLAFNIGEAAFKRSSVCRLHNAEKYPEAQQAFGLWNKAGGKVVNGLVTRRAREADRYDDDELPTDIPDMPQAVEGEAPLSQSRGIRGGTGAAVATAGTVVAGAVQHADLSDVEPSVILDGLTTVLPYLAQFGWLIGGVALVFIAWQMYARYNDRQTGRA